MRTIVRFFGGALRMLTMAGQPAAGLQQRLVLAEVVSFAAVLLWIAAHIAVRRPSLFIAPRARLHRLLGLAQLMWIAAGLGAAAFAVLTMQPDVSNHLDTFHQNAVTDGNTSDEAINGCRTFDDSVHEVAPVASASWGLSSEFWLFYDVTLGALGLGATLSAVRSFSSGAHTPQLGKGYKRHQLMAPSGPLDFEATVTTAEMVEHAFYQGLNIVQIIYLHTVPHVASAGYFLVTLAPGHSDSVGIMQGHSIAHPLTSVVQMLLLLSATAAPWALRDRFPVHSFSANYKEGVKTGTVTTRLLYRLKKWQYLFYKHFLFHGLNISVSLATTPSVLTALTLDTSVDLSDPIQTSAARASNLVREPLFQIYWIALNASFVLEFFLQTLVKRKILAQREMLCIQPAIMLISTVPALFVLSWVNLPVALFSMSLNFLRRGHEVLNVTTVLLVAIFVMWGFCV